MTTKQISIQAFVASCGALQRAYDEQNAKAIVRHSLQVHRLKGTVPRHYARSIPK
jgi:hypothetical protein